MSIEYYVFETELVANNALSYINGIAEYPWTGINAKTGVIAENKAETLTWDTPALRLDGKWVFQRLPESIREQYPQSMHDLFNTNYPNTIETKQLDWFEE